MFGEFVRSQPYLVGLAAASALVFGLERLFPARAQRVSRPALRSDLAHLVFNAHFLGVFLYAAASRWVSPAVEFVAARVGLDGLGRGVAATWPIWLQALVAIVVIDAIQWGVHNALHRIPWLWELHKCHHSVEDGEMDWIASFRFQWTEVVVYKSVQLLPLLWFGFAPTALLAHALVATLIGHLNHANLSWDYGPLRYVLNSPKMHIWHHDYDRDATNTVNFGVILSVWDWLLGTAYLPAQPPARLGFSGVEEYPKGFLAAESWFLRPIVGERLTPPVAIACSSALVSLGAWLVWG